MANLGRISGQLLKDNLTRNGHDLAFDTDLLFLNVNSRVISVNTDTTDPARALLVDGKTLTTNLDSTSLYFPNSLSPTFSISSNEIASDGILNLVASSYVNADEIITDKISINGNIISTLGTNQLLSIEPNGTGTVEIVSSVNITGNLTTPNDITLDGHITFGSDNQDSISFAADINSNIIPDQTDLYSLGSNPVSGNRWEGLHTELINGQEITSLGLVSGDINLALRQGNIWYVAANGSDTNVGDHQEGPFATIGHALTQADAGDEIFIYPGTYEEDFPLTIPVGVSVKGSGIRSVTVTPTAGTNTNNAFVMNGETTVSDLTVKDFYTGYAFSFASNFKVTTRSPYVQNISVITQESSLGAGDAGKGALVDGSVAHPDTKEASMLFHSVTFITPDVDAITMTNGVRVEWLNSFIYYANRGLYATEGTEGFNPTDYVYDSVTGKYLPSNAIRFSLTCEAASPYVTPVGANNFHWRTYSSAYVSRGVFGSSVISTLVSSGLPVTPTSSPGTETAFAIYDHNTSNLVALFTIYDIFVTDGSQYVFWIDFNTGNKGTVLYPVGGDYNSLINSTTVGNVYDWVFVPNVSTFDGYKTAEELGIKFGAEIRSIGSANVYGTYGAVADGASTLMYLINHNFAYIGSGTDSTNDASLNVQENETVELNDGKIYYQSVDNKGNFAVGDAFNVSFETGGASINGITTSATGITSINFSDGTSETIVNSQLVSTGKIKFEDNNINSLSGAINFSSNTGEILLNNNTDISYNLGIDGNFTIDGILTVGNQFIDVVTFNAPVEFDFRPQSPTYKLGSPDNTWSKVYVVATQIDDTVSISANTISTITTNTDLELTANGTGQVKTTTSDVEIDQTLDVAGTSTVQDLSITGAVSLLGDYNQTGNYTQTGNRDVSGTLTVTSDVFFDDINFIDNRILTTIGNNDLELLANGTGIVAFNENLRVVNDFTIGDLESNGLENSLILTSDIFTNSTITITNNSIATVTTDTDLELSANGTGIISVPANNVSITNNLTATTAELHNINLTGTLTHVGNRIQVGPVLRVTYELTTYTKDINYLATAIIIDGTAGDGTAIVTLTSADFIGSSAEPGYDALLDLTIGGTFDGDLGYSYRTFTLTGNWSTSDGGATYQAAITYTGSIFSYSIFPFYFKIPIIVSSTYTDPVYTQTGNMDVSGTLTVTGDVYFDDINFIDNTITTTIGNNDLELLAAGTGIVKFNENLRVVNDFTIETLTSNGLTNSGTITSDIFTNNEITITDNSIATVVGNTDLTLTAAGTGLVYFPTDPVLIDNNLIVADTANLKNTVINGILDHIGATAQTGNITDHTGNFDLTGDLTVTGTNAWFKDIRIVNNQIYTSLTNSDLILSADGTGIINLNDYANFGVDLTVSGLTSTSTLTSTGIILSDIFTDSDIEIYDNIITTTLGNNNLILTGNGTGGPTLEKIKFNADTISTDSSNYNIILTTPGKNVLLNTTTALKVPTGTTVNRPILVQGDVRFNTTDSLYRGYSSAKVTFGGIYSDNLATTVVAHPTNNTLNFTNNSAQTASFSSTGLNVNALQVDDLNFNNSTISSTSTNTDVTFAPNGSGYVTIGTMGLASNEILNLDLTDPLLLQNTNAGYVKFNGTGGIVIPAGDSGSRPLVPQTGDLRWNTDLSEAEVFNGIAYQALSGSGGDVLSAEEVQEVTNLWGLVLG